MMSKKAGVEGGKSRQKKIKTSDLKNFKLKKK
jgi:hypothetical protein